ncbi:MAG: serine hydrolase domain-containing protein [Acidobacteriota bacterium]
MHQGQSRDAHQETHPLPTLQQIDAQMHRAMAATRAKGIAIAVIDKGQVAYVRSYGSRNAAGAPLELDSIMYGASLTKTAFAYLVLQLVDRGILDLDRSIAQYLPKPLPDYNDPEIGERYARWSDLVGDDRWRKLTPRLLLNHASGFSNFGFLETDGKLKFHFDPGTRYSYSGDGIILLQFVLEKGLGLNVGEEMQKGIFDALGMKNTSLIWRRDFNGRTADGWSIDGKAVPHDDRSKVRAAGSMDTTISDIARLAAALARGDLVSSAARELSNGSPIGTENPLARRRNRTNRWTRAAGAPLATSLARRSVL